jgi:atypical dual specificity phosphatase
MTPRIYDNLWWVIDGELAGMGKPDISVERRLRREGSRDLYVDDLPLLYDAGIRAVVSLLNIESDSVIYPGAGFVFRNWPVRNGHAPGVGQAREFVAFVDQCRAARRPVAVYCEAGLGRTGTMLAAYLIHLNQTPADAIAAIRRRERAAIETPLQLEFLDEFYRSESARTI